MALAEACCSRSRWAQSRRLLAGACVAPVVIQVVLFASNLYATGTHVALALPFFLGIGMAIPWPIAGAGISALPKPGKMDGPRQAGIWRVHPDHRRVLRIRGVFNSFESLGRSDGGRIRVQEQVKSGWHSSLAEGLAVAKREKKPVLVDAWATWCKNCLTMDKTTLASEDVKQALSGYVKIKFQAEDPDSRRRNRSCSACRRPGYPLTPS